MNLEGYDQSDFSPQLIKDIAGAKICVRFALFSYTPTGVAALADAIREAIGRGVPVCAFLLIPYRWDQRHLEKDEKKKRVSEKEEAIEMLRELGVHVTMVPKVHTKVVIIDYKIFWRGSLNSMSCSPEFSKEQMERSLDSRKALEALIRYELDKCPHCMKIAETAPPNDNVFENENSIAKIIRANRIAMDLSQDELAMLTGIGRVQIGRIERGEHVPGIDKAVRLLDALNLKLVALPEYTINLVHWLIAQSPKPLEWHQKSVKAKLRIRKPASSLRLQNATPSKSKVSKSKSSVTPKTTSHSTSTPTTPETVASSPPKPIEGIDPTPHVQKMSSEASSSEASFNAHDRDPSDSIPNNSP